MIYLLQLSFWMFTLFFAGRDSVSISQKEKEFNELTKQRNKWWHTQGGILYAIFVLTVCCTVWYYDSVWFGLKLGVAAALTRVILFDPALNHWSGWSITHLGTTAAWDKIFKKLFGKEGAMKKTIAFFILLVILNLVNEFYTIALNLFS